MKQASIEHGWRISCLS